MIEIVKNRARFTVWILISGMISHFIFLNHPDWIVMTFSNTFLNRQAENNDHSHLQIGVSIDGSLVRKLIIGGFNPLFAPVLPI